MIDNINLTILKILQKKARIPNVEIARQVGMAPSAVLERIRKLEKCGIIDGYEVRLNPKRFGHTLVAFLLVKTKGSTYETYVGKALTEIPEVQEVHFIAGEDCYFLKVRVTDTDALQRLIREKITSVEGVRSTRTTIVLSTLKETSGIPIDTPGFVNTGKH